MTGRRADVRMKNAGVIVYKKYEQVKHSPPLVHVRGGVAVYTFFSGKVK